LVFETSRLPHFLDNRLTDGSDVTRELVIFKYVYPIINYHIYAFVSRDSSVGITTGYLLVGWGSIPGRGKIFLFSTASRPIPGSTQPPIHWVQWFWGGGGLKRPGRETDHSSQLGIEARFGGALAPFPHTSPWRGAQSVDHRDSFAVLSYLCFRLLIASVDA
jgi:hypothetical protein